MEESKKEIYGDSHTYENECGVLLARLVPHHRDDAMRVRRVFFSAIDAMYQLHYKSLQKFNTGFNLKFNNSIHTLKEIRNRFRKEANEVLKQNTRPRIQ